MLTSTLSFRTIATVLLVLSHLLSALAQQHTSLATDDTTVSCRPFGQCEPCPKDALHEPFCQPFGNRRLMHCMSVSKATIVSHNLSPPTPSNDLQKPHGHRLPPTKHVSDPPQGETPAWESCGRIVEQERADFWEFVACNVIFAVCALFLLAARSRKLEALQARRLAARIGLIRNTTGE